MVTKKIRTEYMKKFKDPKWETFSKCYEDSLKYRLTRRVMEHAHKPWFWEGWDNGSESSGRSTPRSRNKVAPLTATPLAPAEPRNEKSSEQRETPDPKPPSVNGEPEVQAAAEAPVLDPAPPTKAVIENGGLSEIDEGPGSDAPATKAVSDETGTDDGPADKATSDEDPLPALVKTEPRPRHRHRTPRSEPGNRDSPHGNEVRPLPVRKPSRAKSQPPVGTKERPTEKENRRPAGRHDWVERQEAATRRSTNESRTSDACVQTGQPRRESDKRGSNLDRRRARSADLEKMKQSELTVVDDRWMTEYMRCFSARLR